MNNSHKVFSAVLVIGFAFGIGRISTRTDDNYYQSEYEAKAACSAWVEESGTFEWVGYGDRTHTSNNVGCRLEENQLLGINTRHNDDKGKVIRRFRF